LPAPGPKVWTAAREAGRRFAATGARGIAARPPVGFQGYLSPAYAQRLRIGPKGLWSELHAIWPRAQSSQPWMQDIADIIRTECAELPGIEWLS